MVEIFLSLLISVLCLAERPADFLPPTMLSALASAMSTIMSSNQKLCKGESALVQAQLHARVAEPSLQKFLPNTQKLSELVERLTPMLEVFFKKSYAEAREIQKNLSY